MMYNPKVFNLAETTWPAEKEFKSSADTLFPRTIQPVSNKNPRITSTVVRENIGIR